MALFRVYPAGMSVMLGVVVLWSVDVSVRPYLLKLTLDRFHPFSLQLLLPMGLYVLWEFVSMMSFRLSDYFIYILTFPKLRQRIAQEILNQVFSQPGFGEKYSPGHLANQFGDLIKNIPKIVSFLFEKFLKRALELVFAGLTLWHVHFVFSLVMCFWIVAFFLSYRFFFTSFVVNRAQSVLKAQSSLIGDLVDILSNFFLVRLLKNQESDYKHLNQRLDTIKNVETLFSWAQLWVRGGYGVFFWIIQIINLCLLYQGSRQGWLTTGDCALVLSLNAALMRSFWKIVQDLGDFSRVYGRFVQSLHVLTSSSLSLAAPCEGVHLKNVKGKIAFVSVGFSYKRQRPLFSKQSLSIPPGQRVGLVGPSGSGKSTFVHLILRLHEVDSGTILIDNHDIRLLTKQSLSDAITMIPQNPYLFRRSILDNIRYSRSDATYQEVVQAAKKAHAHNFIMALPFQYNTVVDDGRNKLSGGQRQRISIARAFLRNTPIVILDEPTSQVDTITEDLLQKSFENLMRHKTALIIAHRLSTLQAMDRILVFDKGSIVEDGSHYDLMSQRTRYYKLWESDKKGF